MSDTAQRTANEEVTQAELERCRLVNVSDWDGLSKLIADDLTFVHSVGVVDNKEVWIDKLKQSPRHFFRDGLKVQVFGDVAVTTGGLFHVFLDDKGAPRSVLPAIVTQVWVKRDGRWQLLVNQHTRTPPIG